MSRQWVIAHHFKTGVEMYFDAQDICRIVKQVQVVPRVPTPEWTDEHENIYVTMIVTEDGQAYPVWELPAQVWTQVQAHHPDAHCDDKPEQEIEL